MRPWEAGADLKSLFEKIRKVIIKGLALFVACFTRGNGQALFCFSRSLSKSFGKIFSGVSDRCCWRFNVGMGTAQVEIDGLVWGEAHKLVAVAFGVKKLVISAVIEDEKVK